MVKSIPVLNVYYLLSYAWDKLQEAETIDISPGDCHNVTQLCARILANGTQHLVRRGFDRDYMHHREETSRPRGRMDVTASMSGLTWHRGVMVCEFDELSHDVLHNRILKTTIDLLRRADGLTQDDRKQLQEQSRILCDITPIHITSSLFRRVQLHRNNRYYRFLLNVCELVYQSLLPTEEIGQTRFRDFTRNHKAMAALFEKFVRNFYRQHLNGFSVGALSLDWNPAGEPESLALVPGMQTDVTLQSKDRSIILDCKYYGEALATTQYGKQTFKSANLYQLYAYLRNARRQPGWENAEGILLYPVTTTPFDHKVVIDGYSVRVTSIDLAQPWQEIHNSLLRVIESSPSCDPMRSKANPLSDA
ncbi:MAG: 5-methylcytosine-specific restriction endonuclease system specificity protein McrC [Verrucomicrobiae bacterium]|nr:5-methylcytosine-specific restriction endonuclease system specificity protein McrC [Verrucomicrobiae bacterium]